MSQRKDYTDHFYPENLTDLQVSNLLKRITLFNLDADERKRREENEKIERRMEKMAKSNPEKDTHVFEATIRNKRVSFIGTRSDDKNNARYAYGYLWNKV